MIRRKRDGRTFVVLDCHLHMGESLFLKEFRRRDSAFFADELVRHMDHYGQDMACGFPTVDITDYSENTERILAASRQYPDRLIPFTRINPHYMGAANTVSDWVEKGIRGLKFHPMRDAFVANDPTLVRPVLEEANRFGLTALFHSGGSWMSLPGLIYDLALDYKDVKFIIGHAGGYGFDHEAMALARRAENIWLDTTELYPSQRIRTLVDAVGREKVVFGSDSPYLNAASEIEKVLRFSELDDGELEAVFGMNLARILGIDPAISPSTVVDYPIEAEYLG